MTEVQQGAANVELVHRALGAPSEGVDMVEFIADDDRWAELAEAFPQGFTEDCSFAWVALGQRESERRGIDGLRSGWREWIEPWIEYRSYTEEVRPVGDDKVLVFARQVGVPREGAPIEMQAAALATIRDGRICSVDFYARRDEALEAAGEAG